MMNEQKIDRLKSLVYRMKMLMDEYNMRETDYQAGPLLKEVEKELEDLPAEGGGRLATS